MALTSVRVAHSRLGTYYGIFISAFVALGAMTLILEGLGASNSLLRGVMLLGPIVLYAAIASVTYTADPLDYFACGRRVPAFYTGLGLATAALGGTGLVSVTGAFFLIGFDAVCLVIGGVAGFVFMSVLLAPFFRKFGAFTIPSYLGRRFDSRLLRLIAAVLLAVPAAMLLAAELITGAYAIEFLMPGMGAALTISVMVTVLAMTLGTGGMRSLSWISSAQGIAALIAVLVPVTVVAVMLTNLPLPQLSHGPVLRNVGRSEAAMGMPLVLPPALAFDMPSQMLQPIAKRFSDAMSSVGPLAFVITMLTTLAGVASAPWLLTRVAATPGVYEARKSLGWATVMFGILMLTLASIAVFMRSYVFAIFSGPNAGQVPDWINALTSLGTIAAGSEGGRLQISNLEFARDGILFSLPVAAGLPSAALYLTAAGVLAAALATAGASLVALGSSIAEDIGNGLSFDPLPDKSRLIVARSGLAIAAVAGACLAVLVPSDPLKLVLWALALTGSAAFPILVLSIWWKRLNAFGAVAGLVSGFGVVALAIVAGETGQSEIQSALSGVFGIPAGFVAAIAVSLVTPAPSKHLFEFVRDIRVPGGEIIYDRETRLAKRKKT
ncbi:MAG: sodium:solute symporter [Hyphomicrobium sp.]